MSDVVKILCRRMHAQNSIIPRKCGSGRLILNMIETTQINLLINPSRKNLNIDFEHYRLNLL